MENGRASSEFKLTARRALELATIDAARIIGVDKQVGSLVPGKPIISTWLPIGGKRASLVGRGSE
jgi:cytosine/adenosine deaminase-related metal-dependent hydrolase